MDYIIFDKSINPRNYISDERIQNFVNDLIEEDPKNFDKVFHVREFINCENVKKIIDLQISDVKYFNHDQLELVDPKLIYHPCSVEEWFIERNWNMLTKVSDFLTEDERMNLALLSGNGSFLNDEEKKTAKSIASKLIITCGENILGPIYD